jgi:hypothetical protein
VWNRLLGVSGVQVGRLQRAVRPRAALAVLLASAAVWAAPELLKGVRYRAVTLAPEERKLFTIPEADRVTASSGACLEEALDVENTHTLIITASCEGLRTSMVWLKDGSRIAVLACAEASQTSPELKKLRLKVQGDLKGWKSATACVRNGVVQMWGWVESQEDKDRIARLVEKYGPEKVADKVEYVEP